MNDSNRLGFEVCRYAVIAGHVVRVRLGLCGVMGGDGVAGGRYLSPLASHAGMLGVEPLGIDPGGLPPHTVPWICAKE